MSKLLFFDIDGTLCMPGDAPSKRTASAIRNAREKGNLCFLSTGRNITSIPEAVNEIGFDGYITNAGATAAIGDKLLLSIPIPEDLLHHTLQVFQENDAVCVLQTNEGNYCEYAQIGRIWENCPAQIEEYVEFTKRILGVKDVSELGDYDPVYKICFYTPSEEGYLNLRSKLSEWYSFTMFDNLFDDFVLISGEINQHCVDKGKALKTFCDYFHKDVRESIAFGDSTNDLQMLRAAGMGVAMDNAQPEVKQYADRICPHCKQDGVAQILEEMGLT
jgi:Cof subfamily protein (haloacid dehalogenase superfamily)